MSKQHALVAKNRLWTILGDTPQPDVVLRNRNFGGLNLLSSELLQKVFTEGRIWIPESATFNTTIYIGVII